MIVGRPLIRVTETTSTMDLASRLAELGAPPGTAVLAGHQTAGRGRSRRIWTAAPWSSILLSIIVDTGRDRSRLGPLSLLVGLAVAETVDAFTGACAAIKWPNDVLVNGDKVAGILIVNRVIPDRPGSCLVTGIGLNVNSALGDLPDGATSLAGVSGQAHALDLVLHDLCERLTATFGQFEREHIADLLERIDARLAFRGEPVRIQDGPRRYDGLLRGVSAEGALLLEPRQGDMRAVVAGELTRGPRRTD